MNKSDLVKAISQKYEMPQTQVRKVIQEFLDETLETLVQGQNVSLTGFGRFSAKVMPKRTRRNPKSGEKVKVDESISLRFKPSRRAQVKINELFLSSKKKKKKKKK